MDEKIIKSLLICKCCGTILDEACINCNFCGTEAGEGDTIGFEGDFEPDNNLMECIYGPPPCDYNFVCRSCEHSWTEYLMLVNETKSCPKCGSSDIYVQENNEIAIDFTNIEFQETDM